MNPPARRVIVVLRQSPDWHALARGGAHDSASFDALIGRPAGTTASLIAFWDQHFAASFFAARARMKDIASTSLHAVMDADLIALGDLGAPFDAEALYAFTDDDDWFHPEIAQALLGSQAPVGDGAVWTSVRFDGTVMIRPNDGFCYTNNYALHGAFLDRCGDHAHQLTQHMGAQHFLHQPDVTVARLDAALSVTNKHPCSTVTLEKAKNGEIDLVALLARYRGEVPDRDRSLIAWAEPAMKDVSAFFAPLASRAATR